MNESLLYGVVAAVLVVVVLIALVLRDGDGRGGLSPKHRSELNKVLGVDPARYNELRSEYAGDDMAQQQIDVYDGSSEYHRGVCAYRDALRSGDGMGESCEE